MKKGITVLSLCDGMSCGQIALERAGVEVERYFASEIKDIGIKVTKENYPATIHIGDVNKISYKNNVLSTEVGDFDVVKIDLVIFGSPCQTFSIAIPTKERTGLNNIEKSGLFYQCYRVLKEVNPKYFLMENVASMKETDKDVISKLMGVSPIKIDSALVTGALRKRYYWTNIGGIEQPEKKTIELKDILEDGYTDRKKARCLAVIDSRPNTTPIKMVHRYFSTGFTTLIFKSEEHYKGCKKFYDREFVWLSAAQISKKMEKVNGVEIFDGVRYMNQHELEKCQTVPKGYTQCLTRNEAADVLGDGWTVDVIAHIFKHLNLNLASGC